MTSSHRGRHTEATTAHWLEWLTGLVSLALIASLIGYIGWKALNERMVAPELVVEIEDIQPVSSGFRVSFRIENRANTSAAAVTVRGEIAREGQAVESNDITFDYVPAESTATGAVLFQTDPARGDFSLRPLGYTDP